MGFVISVLSFLYLRIRYLIIILFACLWYLRILLLRAQSLISCQFFCVYAIWWLLLIQSYKLEWMKHLEEGVITQRNLSPETDSLHNELASMGLMEVDCCYILTIWADKGAYAVAGRGLKGWNQKNTVYTMNATNRVKFWKIQNSSLDAKKRERYTIARTISIIITHAVAISFQRQSGASKRNANLRRPML